jgi:hypothetical protein
MVRAVETYRGVGGSPNSRRAALPQSPYSSSSFGTKAMMEVWKLRHDMVLAVTTVVESRAKTL